MGTQASLTHLLAVRSLPADLLVGYLVTVMPLAGRARYRRLTGADPLPVAPSGSSPRIASYVRGMRLKWALAALSVLLLVCARVPLRSAGLLGAGRRWPELSVALLPALGAGLVLTLVMRGSPRLTRRLLAPVAGLLPSTRGERRVFAAVAVTAGVTEEVLYRGFVLHLLLHAGLSQQTSLVAMAAAFGGAHLYQGLYGVAGTGLAGYALGELALSSGSLLVPVVVHALVDLRVLLLVAPAQEDAPAEPDAAGISA